MFKYGIYPKYKVQDSDIIPYENPPLIGVAENEQSLREELRFCTVMQYVELDSSEKTIKESIWQILQSNCTGNPAELENYKGKLDPDLIEWEVYHWVEYEDYQIGISYNPESNDEYADLLNNIAPETFCKVVEINAPEAYLVCEKMVTFNDDYDFVYQDKLKRNRICLSLDVARHYQFTASISALIALIENYSGGLETGLRSFNSLYGEEEKFLTNSQYRDFLLLAEMYFDQPSSELEMQLMAYIKDHFYTITRI